MNESTLTARLEAIEAGYEFCLAYAAQGRSDDAGTPARQMLTQMHAALGGIAPLLEHALQSAGAGAGVFLDAVRRDATVAQSAIAFVLAQPALSSLLVDNLNASIHLRALLTDLFLIDQANKGAAPRG
jgi:hypothetical protein